MLERFKGKARVIAGGTDVIPELRRRDLQAKALVDISRLPGLNAIKKDGRHIILGGLVTHGQVASSPLIREKAGLLADGAAAVGSPQIRNIATVAGNLVSGRPAADTSIPLLALEASVTIASKKGERVVPLTEFFVSVGKTVLDPSREVLTHIRFQGLQPDQGGCYLRLSKRRALTLPVLVAAAVVTVDSTARVFKKAAIALGPVAPTPFRARESEAGLKGAPLSREAIQKAAGIGRPGMPSPGQPAARLLRLPAGNDSGFYQKIRTKGLGTGRFFHRLRGEDDEKSKPGVPIKRPGGRR